MFVIGSNVFSMKYVQSQYEQSRVPVSDVDCKRNLWKPTVLVSPQYVPHYDGHIKKA